MLSLVPGWGADLSQQHGCSGAYVAATCTQCTPYAAWQRDMQQQSSGGCNFAMTALRFTLGAPATMSKQQQLPR